MIVLDMPQLSDEWFAEKAGKPGASSFDRIVTTKGERSKSQPDYLYQLAGEQMAGYREPGYSSPAMQVGVEREAESRALFEFLTGQEVRQVGLVYRDEKRDVLCSPDGLLDDCGLELKNPLSKTQAKYLDKGVLPPEYFQQVQGSMWVTGFSHWWFMSYYPGMPPFLLKAERDDTFCEALGRELDRFVAELLVLVQKLRGTCTGEIR